MSATSWRQVPSYTPFSHTSNSQYGAWLGGAAPFPAVSPHADSLKSHHRIAGSLLPPSPPKVGAITAVDVSKIVSASGTSEGSSDKFSDIISKYGAPSRVPLSLSRTTEISGLSREEPRFSTASSGFGTQLETSSRKYNTLPSRSRHMGEDLGLHRSRTTLGSQFDSYSKSSDPRQFPVSGTQEKYQSYSKNYSTAGDIAPGLSRSNTFHGDLGYRTGGASEAPSYNSNNYSDRMLGAENHSASDERSAAALDCQTQQRKYSGVPFADITQDRNVPALGSEGHVPRPPVGSSTGGRESHKRSWLYGTNRPPQTSSVQPRPFTPYRPGDYLFRTENAEEIIRKYKPTSDVLSSISTRRNNDILEPSKDKNTYTNGYAESYPERHILDEHLTNSTHPYDSDTTHSSDLYGSFLGKQAQKSILKKGPRSAPADHVRSAYAQNDVPSYGRGFHAYSAQAPLPPLSALDMSTGLGKTSSGKRVTFNLALNRSRAILD